MIKIFLTGSAGFFGQYFNNLLKKKYFIFNHQNKNSNKKIENNFKLNLLNKKKINKLINKISPDIILHAAAITDVDYCEKNKKKALDINYHITKNLVDIARKKKKYFIFISTDQLFDGNKNKYNEKSQYSPINNYAYSKMKSEIYIKNKLKNFLIIRTNFFGKAPQGRKSFSDFIINNIKSKKKIYLFQDIIFNPVHLTTLITYLEKLLINKKRGIFNISSDKPISKFHFGKKIVRKLNISDKYIIKSNISNFRNYRAKRPKFMFLDNKKLKRTLKINKIDINNDIKKLFNNLVKSK